MRIFITGATGFIGRHVVAELIGAGHEVLGLARDPAKAAALSAAGAEIFLGDMMDFGRLAEGVRRSDGVIHLAFNHDFSDFFKICEQDRQVVRALGAALIGSARPLLVTSGVAIAARAPGEPAREDAPRLSATVFPRAASEEEVEALVAQGVKASIIRLPQVHDRTRQGFVTMAIEAFRLNGFCGYVGAGQNRWSAAHVLDVARLYRLALESSEAGAVYHAAAEEGVSARDVAETVARRLHLPTRSIAPEDAEKFFGWLTPFAGLDMSASSALTRQRTGWRPIGPGLLEDLAELELAAA